MKLIKFFALSFATAASLQAATVTVDTGFTRGLLDAAGNNVAVGSGYLAIGYFGSLSDASLATTSAAGLEADFQIFGTSTATFGKSGLSGFFAVSSSTAGKIDATNPFVGQNIYLVAMNGADIGSSSSGLIYKFADQFVADPADPTPPSSLTPNYDVANNAAVLLGNTGGTLSGAVAAPAAQMANLVPEPSVALLGALGLLGLLRRRR